MFYCISFSLIIYKSTYFPCCLIKRALRQVFQYFQRNNSEVANQCNLICFLLLWVMWSLLFITFHFWVICILLCEICSFSLLFIPLNFWKYLCTIHLYTYMWHIYEKIAPLTLWYIYIYIANTFSDHLKFYFWHCLWFYHEFFSRMLRSNLSVFSFYISILNHSWKPFTIRIYVN